MNEDFERQESTEEYTDIIIRNDDYLRKCLREDDININNLIDFKKYTIVDNDRPKLCADRIDGVILTGIGWVREIDKNSIDSIIDDLCIFKNEFGEDEIGFTKLSVVEKVINVSKSIDISCHSNEDNYMMQLLSKITKYSIDKGYIKYDDLYSYSEDELFKLFINKKDNYLNSLLDKFFNIKKCEVPEVELSNVKIRKLNPLLNGSRI